MKTNIIILLLLLFGTTMYAQQIAVPRIEAMPRLPQPYVMRDWKQTARGYDSLVFNTNLQGQYLPLLFFKNQGVNYPEHGFWGLHTVVGTTRPTASEAINALPAIVGASLTGIDKSNQFGKNFVLWAEDYFNRRAEENVYLNNPVGSSGIDWWYETMPNIYFLQIQSLYPHTGSFDVQSELLATRWQQAIQAMGASDTPWKVPVMNYRAFKLSTMTPLTSGVIEPEAAGALAWIMLKSYRNDADKQYRVSAEQCLDFLNNLTQNPSYELQLSYGAAAAAYANAELGTNYNVEKLLNWCFDTGALRNWGAFTGTWGAYDVSGLIGEQSSNGYAFIMNGFQQAGALLPVARYDERFARALGKWLLNLANASRLFYSKYLPADMQDGYAWASQYDPHSYIAYEALRQSKNGRTPFATGDAVEGGWGLTNLSLYSSSSVGYLGALIDTTNVPAIIKVDLLKTDFLKNSAYPTYLYYNPYLENKTVTISVPAGTHSVYDAVQNTYVAANVSGETSITIPADNALILVFLPANSTPVYSYDKMLVNNIVVDYHSGHFNGDFPPRIRSLNTAKHTMKTGETIKIYCTAQDNENSLLQYSWICSRGSITGAGSIVSFTENTAGIDTIICRVTDIQNNSVTDTLIIQVVERINSNPQIQQIQCTPAKTDLSKPVRVVCTAGDPDSDSLTFQWRINGQLLPSDNSVAAFTAPSTSGNYWVSCTVHDGYGGSASDSSFLVVRDYSSANSGQLVAWYRCDGNGLDNSGFANNAFAYSVQSVPDRNGNAASALLFNGTSSYLQVHNNASLNFTNTITINFWMTPKYFYEREQYPISHGNWERRWKISVTNKKIRWTVKTNSGIKDIDAKTVMQLDSTYNITALYDGLGMELYINGVLEGASAFSGAIQTTDYDLTIGQVLPGNTNYNYNGILDEVRLYNGVLLPDSISALSGTVSAIDNNQAVIVPGEFGLGIYPNPCNASTVIRANIPAGVPVQISLKDILGREIKTVYEGITIHTPLEVKTDLASLASGVYFITAQAGKYFQVEKLMIVK